MDSKEKEKKSNSIPKNTWYRNFVNSVRHFYDRYIGIKYFFIAVVTIFIISSIWISIKHSIWPWKITSSYFYYFFYQLKFEVFIGILVSFAGVALSAFILDAVKKFSASNSSAFLEIANEILKNVNQSDDILIVSPTLYIGYSSNSTLRKAKIFTENIINIVSSRHKSNNNSKNKNETKVKIGRLKIFTLNGHSEFISSFKKPHNESHKDESKKYNTIESSQSSLVKFHFNLLEKKKGTKDVVDYFQGLVNFYSEIDFLGFDKNEIPPHILNINPLIILNISKKEGVFGTFNSEYDISANKITEEGAIKALERLIKNGSDK